MFNETLAVGFCVGKPEKLEKPEKVAGLDGDFGGSACVEDGWLNAAANGPADVPIAGVLDPNMKDFFFAGGSSESDGLALFRDPMKAGLVVVGTAALSVLSPAVPFAATPSF